MGGQSTGCHSVDLTRSTLMGRCLQTARRGAQASVQLPVPTSFAAPDRHGGLAPAVQARRSGRSLRAAATATALLQACAPRRPDTLAAPAARPETAAPAPGSVGRRRPCACPVPPAQRQSRQIGTLEPCARRRGSTSRRAGLRRPPPVRRADGCRPGCGRPSPAGPRAGADRRRPHPRHLQPGTEAACLVAQRDLQTDLQDVVTQLHGDWAVRPGAGEPDDVFHRLDLTRPESLHMVRAVSAERDVARGRSVPDAPARHRIDSHDETVTRHLEDTAARTHGRCLRHADMDVDAVRRRLGLQRPEGIQTLRSFRPDAPWQR